MPQNPADKSRDKLLKNELRLQSLTLDQFRTIRGRLIAQIDDLLIQIEHLRQTEGNAPPALILRKTRLQSILDELDDEIRKTSGRLATITSKGQDKAIDIAASQARVTPGLETSLGMFDAPAVREIVGIAADGAPLAKHFAALSKPVRDAMFRALFFGIATGRPNREIAAEVRGAIDGGTTRAMTIVRTEINRAYREASRKVYDETPAVVGWRWLAALDLRTCPLCWALHGRIFKTSTKFGTHPNCRCTMVPVFADDPKVPTGPERFAELNETQQKAILGPGRLELYKQGANLRDFVGQSRSAFGVGRFVKPIRDTTFEPNPRGPGIEPIPPARGGAVPSGFIPKRSN